MARMVRMTHDEIIAKPADIDWGKVNATTEDDIRRYMIEDGEDPDAELGEFVAVRPPALVRKELGMTQDAFAAALHIPLATLRNWEQGRTRPDPAAQALLRAVANDPKAVLAAIAG